MTLMVIAGLGSQASAEDWMFRRSYFSHAVPEDDPNRMPEPPIRYAHRPPFISGSSGYHLRGGHRYNRVQINAGSGVDVTVFYDEWFRTAP
jgi:hypothetical protein